MAPAGAAVAGRHLLPDQSAAAAGESRRAFDQACTLPLVAAGGESSDAAALREHAAKDRDAAIASEVSAAQSKFRWRRCGGGKRACGIE